MRDIIENLVRSIVFDEDSLQIVEETGPSQTRLTLRASGKDVGRLLGKRGTTINALRDVVDILADRQGQGQTTVWVEGSPS